MTLLRRPPLQLALLLVAVLFAVAVLGLGLVRAAFYEPPSATSVADNGVAAVQAPVPSVAGRCGTQEATAPRELRGMWLTTVYNIDFPSKQGLSQEKVKAEYLKWVDLAVARRHNAIFVHVRPSGDAFWPSEYAPWSNWLTGRLDGSDPGWDPMAFMVDEAHQRNLEFHAWFNPYRGTQPAPSGAGADLTKLPADHALRTHPEWRIAYPTGKNSRLYFDPGVPEARRFVEDAMLEAVRKYDIDGVHFDDFFYPYPEKGEDFPDDASFAKYGAGKSRADWRRENVNLLVREMQQRIAEIKPWVKYGISPFGIWRNGGEGSDTKGLESYDTIYADTRKWVREGWLDYIVPQLYWTIGFDKADYAKVLPWWAKTVKGTSVQLYIGMADYRVGEKGDWSDPAELDRQMAMNDKFGVQGQVHFSAKQVRSDRLGSVSRYQKAHYATPALQPRMERLPVAAPPAPRITGVGRGEKGETILATAATEGVSWALYRTGESRATLVATGRAGAAVVDPAPPSGPVSYCLSGLDRSGNEGPLSEAFTTGPS
ncbi:family 10 glycosylhydrolase [Actinoplanes sp. NBRC 101535]|uniref:glycoside hydrolase family 10 protein n=1 Tax=Actinoplanes sp. NBRC 101535 TaxID=3032196 RepID=UPI00249FFF47|nr:family 10 glycosylhydrolase [Actinoplanes sp. NBRC 101535]GLY00319.1 glycosyl hydrolase [Actinoplanes sp. NBRC 101535]